MARLEALLDDFQPSAIEERSPQSRRVHFLTAAGRDDALRTIARELGDFGVSASSSSVDDEDWARRSQDNLRAVRVGNITVAPPWDLPRDEDQALGARRSAIAPRRDPEAHGLTPHCLVPSSRPPKHPQDLSLAPNAQPPASIVIVIEPSMGFGTGHHASTRLSLRLLQTLDVRGKTVLDLGTGSGVLAIGAHRLGAATVIAVDSDADAIDSAARNLAANGIAAGIDLRLGDIRTLELPPSDVLLANLTGALLVDRALCLIQMVKSDGYLVASGFTTDEEQAVSAALGAYGSRVGREGEEEWAALLVKRSLSPGALTAAAQPGGARQPRVGVEPHEQ